MSTHASTPDPDDATWDPEVVVDPEGPGAGDPADYEVLDDGDHLDDDDARGEQTGDIVDDEHDV